MNESTSRIVKCPTCGKSTAWSNKNAHRPFCSERCKMIDFGAWANEEHRIEGHEATHENDSFYDE